MGFSELSLIADDTGLSFDSERSLLYGEKNGCGAVISDIDGKYDVKLFCTQPFKSEAAVISLVNSLAESLPKNTVEKQSCEYGYIHIVLNKYMLLQENIVYLIEFLEKLACDIRSLGLSPEPYKLPKKEKPLPADTPANAEKIKLGFGARSIFGFFGAVLGAGAVTVISVLLVDIKAEAELFGLSSEISSYIAAAAAVALIFFDYIFLAKKLDAFGVITCPLLSLASVYLSAFGAGVKAVCTFENVPPAAAIASFAVYTAKNELIDKFMMGYLTRGAVLAAVASVAVCVWYFRRHPNETVDSEKVVFSDKNK